MRLKKFLSLFLLLVVAITLAACDGGKDKKTTAKPNQAPVISGAKNFSILLNAEAPDLLKGITASDEEDGDLTDFIKVSGSVDTTTEGTYEITYTVKDRDGAETQVKIIVTVASIIFEGISDVTILRGTTFDPKSGVTATSSEGDITSNIVVTGSVDTTKKGEYTITYKVTNAAGATLEVIRKVIVDVLPPTIETGGNIQLLESEIANFDVKNGVTAKDADDKDLTSAIVISGDTDKSKWKLNGKYTIEYKVKDEWDKETTEIRYVFIVTEKVPFANGTYSFRFADTDLRLTFFAAAEEYLLRTMYGGVPVYANAGFNMYSDRLQLPLEKYIPVMGFGTIFGTMNKDDSTVIMDDGKPGEARKYTFRSTLTDNPTTFHQWKYNDSISSDVLSLILDAPYVYKFNSTRDGYDLVPGMAKELPQPVNPTTISGQEVAKEWVITIKDGLTWTYHANTDTSKLPQGHEKIDASDFYQTYKLALQNKWFRAVSGGGDFLTKSQAIAGAAEYVADPTEANWENVGIKLIADQNAIKFIFKDNMSEWNVRYWLASFVMSPINIDLYEQLGDKYGTTPETTAYHGIFKLDYYQPDSVLRMSKNDKYWDKATYFYTGYTFKIIEEQTVRFQEFLDGKLDAASVPTQEYEKYAEDTRLRRVPGATTFRMMINGLGTVENQKKQFPTSTYTPKPILASQDFKLAMYHAIDRKKLAEEVMKTSQTQAYLFTDMYMVDAVTGVAFRNTEQGKNVAKDMIGEGESPGYSPELASRYWNDAIDALVADGTYKPGTTIMLDLRIMSGNPAGLLGAEFIKSQFEEIFQSKEHNIKVKVTITLTAFPDIYYDFMMTGDFDLGIGGISGSTLDAASFLDVFCDDNRGGFTLNWGIDTSIPEIKVTYKNDKGEDVTELWSFNAIVSALNGTVTVVDGVEAD